MTAEERARVREIVERTCKEQGIPLVVPAEVCAEVARLIAVAQGREGGGRREPAA